MALSKEEIEEAGLLGSVQSMDAAYLKMRPPVFINENTPPCGVVSWQDGLLLTCSMCNVAMTRTPHNRIHTCPDCGAKWRSYRSGKLMKIEKERRG